MRNSSRLRAHIRCPVTGMDYTTHSKRLHEVLTRMKNHGPGFAKKCLVMQDQVDKLGHLATGLGIAAREHERTSSTDALVQNNVRELRSFFEIRN